MVIRIGSKVKRKGQKGDYYGVIASFPQKGIANVRWDRGMTSTPLIDLIRHRKKRR